MLSPKRTKFRKAHKGRIHGDAKGGTTLNFGAFGLNRRAPLSAYRRQGMIRTQRQLYSRCTNAMIMWNF